MHAKQQAEAFVISEGNERFVFINVSVREPEEESDICNERRKRQLLEELQKKSEINETIINCLFDYEASEQQMFKPLAWKSAVMLTAPRTDQAGLLIHFWDCVIARG